LSALWAAGRSLVRCCSGRLGTGCLAATMVAAFTLADGPPLLALAVELPPVALIAVTAVAGLAAGAVNPIIGTGKGERVPPGMRARAYGVIGAGAWAAMPLGSLLAGYATEVLER
jgi:MFS family permease